MTTALYRRYRPESFAEVIGQEQVTGPLSVALSKNRVNHAYLFSGPRGCGKTTSARILARCLNCEQGPTPTPCGVCASCVGLARGGPGSLDVVEIDAASHGGVDDARELRERAAFAPVRDRYKVFIIDEAHMVSPQGFNALLKIVEEPPEHIRFIFATTEPEKVIGTIRSRTHHYPFRLVPPERLTQYLAELCEREGVAVGKGALPLVVRAGGGSVRDSLSVLDQLIGGSGDEGLTYATAVSLLGFTDGALLDDVVDALAASDGGTLFSVVDRVVESGHDPRRFVEDLLERLRDLLVVAALSARGSDAHAVLRGVPDDQLERMRNQAARYGSSELSRAADVTNTALTDMTGATSPRLQLELLCARLLLPAVDDGQLGFGARLDRLERRLGSGGGVAAPVAAGPSAAPPPVAPAPAAPVPAAPAPAAPAAAAPAPVASAPISSGGPGAAPSPARPSTSPAPAATEPGPGAATEPPAEPGRPVATDWGPPVKPASPPAGPATEPGARPAVTAVSRPAASASGPGDLEAIRRSWSDVLIKMATIRRITWSLVSQYAQVLDYDGQRLLLGFDSPGRAVSFGRGAHADVVRQALIDVIGLDCRVEAATDQQGAGQQGAGQQGAGQQGSAAPAARPSAPAVPARSAPRREPSAQDASGEDASGQEASGRGASAPSASAAPGAAAAPTTSTAPGQASGQEGDQASSRPSSATPSSARPASARPESARPESARPESARPESARPESARPASTRPGAVRSGAGRSADGPRRGGSTTPYDDIPPSLDEPVPEDEVPPDDGWATRSSQSTRPGQGRQAPAKQPAARPAAPERPREVDVRSSGPTGPTGQAAAATGPTVLPRDDVPSSDDADLEGSNLVGAQVIQQLLGGKVIEDHQA